MLGVLAVAMVFLVFYGCGNRQKPSSPSPVAPAAQSPQELPVLEQNELYKMSVPSQPKMEEETPSFVKYLESKTPKEPQRKSTVPAHGD